MGQPADRGNAGGSQEFGCIASSGGQTSPGHGYETQASWRVVSMCTEVGLECVTWLDPRER